MPKLRHLFHLFLLFQVLIPAAAVAQQGRPKVLKMEIKAEIDPRSNRYTELALKEAKAQQADYVLLELDTYGGAVNDADAIRKRFLEFDKPILVFINKNAASAGALISIACDSIYMAPGANIGAATVVTGDGKSAPGKYQSYMRSMMRSTAEANGRNATMAEAMVDENIKIDTLVQAGQVLTLTTSEAIKFGFCEGIANSAEEVLRKAGIRNAEIIEYQLSSTERIISFFLNPFISGFLILIIIGGLYFELQTPGVGFPLFAAIIAGVLYLTPYYLNGLAANWEILVLLLGLGLIAVEVLVLPGFGLAGISGLVLTFGALVLIMLDNQNFDFTFVPSETVTQSLFAVAAGLFGALLLIVLTWNRMSNSRFINRVVLHQTQQSSEGYHSSESAQHLVGKTGTAYTRLTPSGRIEIDGEIYDAQAREGFIDQGEKVVVTGQSMFTLKVKRAA